LELFTVIHLYLSTPKTVFR